MMLCITAAFAFASNTVMVVSHTESAGWRFNHSTTTASGFVRINADSTFVSRTITNQTLRRSR